MRIFTLLLILLSTTAWAQEPIIDEWLLNTDGKVASYWEPDNNMQNPTFTFVTTTDSADVLQVCYDNDWVYIRAHGMTDNMGQYQNPGEVTAQNYTWRYPRNPAEAANKEDVPHVSIAGALINGIPIFGKGNAASWNNSTQSNEMMNGGQGIWNGEAFYNEGFTLDTAFAAHPAMGQYHTHATPFRLYADPSTSHSPIVGFGNDGFPIYGPFGYSDPNDANSAITRIVPSYQLRNITVRHELPDGTVLNASEYGPDVSNTHPLGEYIEDYEYVQGLGDLDEHNGRFCITPEYPNGTYAYFVGTDNNGDAAFPFFFGTTYYGTPEGNGGPMSNITIPAGVTCVTDGTTSIAEQAAETEEIVWYPNPASSYVRVEPGSNGLPQAIQVRNQLGQLVFQQGVNSSADLNLDVSSWETGLYFCTLHFEAHNSTTRLQVLHD